ncbi:MAG: outer membrane beta-barrel protein [Bdellovibrionales bacterium]
MKNKIALALAALFLGAGTIQTASADLYVEPYLGYIMGSSKNGSTETDFKGANYGLRLGYATLGLAVGFEYEGGMLEDEATPSNDITPTNLGAFVSYEFPILIRAYASYFPKSEAKFKNSLATTTYEGGGMKLGVGFTALPFLTINLEYATNKYDEDENGSLANDVKTKHYGINVSLPLEF